MPHKDVNLVYSKKDKQLYYKDIKIIKGGYKVKPSIASLILKNLPYRLKKGVTYTIVLDPVLSLCNYKVTVVL